MSIIWGGGGGGATPETSFAIVEYFASFLTANYKTKHTFSSPLQKVMTLKTTQWNMNTYTSLCNYCFG